MQTFISDLIPKIQRFSQKLDDLAVLTNQHWVMIDEIERSKNVYIFRSNNELLISSNGEVEKGKWEYLGNNSLLIDKQSKSYLFKHGFFDENVLALKIDGKEEYAFFINENRYHGELNTFDKIIDFLNRKYIHPEVQQALGSQYEVEKPKIIVKTDDEIKKEKIEKSKKIWIAIDLTILTLAVLFMFWALLPIIIRAFQ